VDRECSMSFSADPEKIDKWKIKDWNNLVNNKFKILAEKFDYCEFNKSIIDIQEYNIYIISKIEECVRQLENIIQIKSLSTVGKSSEIDILKKYIVFLRKFLFVKIIYNKILLIKNDIAIGDIKFNEGKKESQPMLRMFKPTKKASEKRDFYKEREVLIKAWNLKKQALLDEFFVEKYGIYKIYIDCYKYINDIQKSVESVKVLKI